VGVEILIDRFWRSFFSEEHFAGCSGESISTWTGGSRVEIEDRFVLGHVRNMGMTKDHDV
jgi:hypothetical protein